MNDKPVIRPPWLIFRLNRPNISLRLDRRVPWIAGIMLLLTLITLVGSIAYGQYDMTSWDVVQTLLGTNHDHPDAANFQLVVLTFRLPRILTAFMVGAALAVAGALMQGLTRNPLADPGLLGVSTGAGLAAVILLVWIPNPPLEFLPIIAFVGGLLTAAVIYILSRKDGGVSSLRMILVGIGTASVLGAIMTTMLTFGKVSQVQQAYIWLTGSVYGRGWPHVQSILIWLAVGLPLAWLMARTLNVLGLGEDVASGLGVRVELQRALLLVISVALTAAAVAVAGTVGFVGLVAPHAVRRLIGSSHEGLIPISALFGGLLMTLADLVGRWVISPSEMPVGVITTVLGAPYFLYLLIHSREN